MGQRTLKTRRNEGIQCNDPRECESNNSHYCQSIRLMPLPMVAVAAATGSTSSSNCNSTTTTRNRIKKYFRNALNIDQCQYQRHHNNNNGSIKQKNYNKSKNWWRRLLLSHHPDDNHNDNDDDGGGGGVQFNLASWMMYLCLFFSIIFSSCFSFSAALAPATTKITDNNNNNPFAYSSNHRLQSTNNNYNINKNHVAIASNNNVVSEKGRAIFDPMTSLFNDIVNASIDDDYKQGGGWGGRNVKQINDFDSSSSSEFKCHGSSCRQPSNGVGVVKRSSSSKTEKKDTDTDDENVSKNSSSQRSYRPKILPQWNTVQAAKMKRSLARQKQVRNNNNNGPWASSGDNGNGGSKIIDSDENEILSKKTISITSSNKFGDKREEKIEVEQNALGPLRIFKYVHHPDELTTSVMTTSASTTMTTTSTSTSTTTPAITTTTTMEPPTTTLQSDQNGSLSSPLASAAPPSSSSISAEKSLEATEKDDEENYYEEDEEADEEAYHDHNDHGVLTSESNTSERSSLIPKSYFDGHKKTNAKQKIEDQQSKEVNASNETMTIVINGTLSPDGYRPRRSPYRPHWRNEKLYTHNHREALYQINSPPPANHHHHQHHLHPPPPGLSQISPSLGPPPQMRMHIPTSKSSSSHQKRHGENRHPFVNPVPIPLPVPPGVSVVLPGYNNNNNNGDRDFSDGFNNGGPPPPMIMMSDAESPEEQSSFRMPSFKNPFAKKRPSSPSPPHSHHNNHNQDGRTAASGNHRRPPPHSHSRPPPGHYKSKGKRGRPGNGGPVPSVMPPPRPVPRPPRPPPPSNGNGMGHHGRSNPYKGGGRPNGPMPPMPLRSPPPLQYSYPKDAANIQDILSYFKQEENEILTGGPPGKPSHGSSSSIHSLSNGHNSHNGHNGGGGMGGGFSNELRDIQGSLLKDIREFAKRPSMLAGEDQSRERERERERERDRSREQQQRDRDLQRQRDSKPVPVPVPIPVPVPSIQSLTAEEDDDPSDEMYNAKSKPVRNLIKLRQREQELSREREVSTISSGGNHHHNNRGHYSSKDEDEEDDVGTDYGKKTKVRPTHSLSSSFSRDRDSHKLNRNRHKNNEPLATIEDDYLSTEEPPLSSQRPRHRDRYEPTSHHQQHQNQNRHNHHHSSSHRDHYKTTSIIKDDGFSDERPYANNLHPAPSVYYRDRQREREEERERERERERKEEERRVQQQRERERERERLVAHSSGGGHRHKSKSSSHKSHRSRHKSHRHHHNNRHKSSNKYASSHLHERFRDVHNREPGAQSVEFVDNPNKISASTMDSAYYRQRNRPIVIKRPYQPYRPVDLQKIEQQRLNEDKHWNTVTTLKLNDDNKVESTRNRPPPPPMQKHYHYYGVGALNNNPLQQSSSSGSSLGHNNRFSPSIIKSTTPINDINTSLDDEDILEIHTGSGLAHMSTTPVYPPPYLDHSGPEDRDKKDRLQKMYMDYLQHKLEAQAEAMFTTPPPPPTTTSKPKRMRMKIHIYPNEGTTIVDRNNNNLVGNNNNNNNPMYFPSNPPPYISASSKVFSNPIYTSSNIHRFGHYPQHTPIQVPPQQSQRPPHQKIIPAQTQTIHTNGGTVTTTRQQTVQTGIDKNKNVVLHLHVHRRNDVVDHQGGQMEMAGSDVHTSTAKPLTYEEIYETSNSDNIHMAEDPPEDDHPHDQNIGQQSNQESPPQSPPQQQQPQDNDKSLSMELPIHQDKIEDVLSTLLKLRD